MPKPGKNDQQPCKRLRPDEGVPGPPGPGPPVTTSVDAFAIQEHGSSVGSGRDCVVWLCIGPDQLGCRKKCVDYSIGSGVLYRLAVVVAIRHRKHAHAGRAGRPGVVFRVADGHDFSRRQAKRLGHAQHRIGVGFAVRERISGVHQVEAGIQPQLREQRLREIVWLVGHACKRQTKVAQRGQPFAHAVVDIYVLAVDGDVRALIGLESLRKPAVGLGRRQARVEHAPDEVFRPLADIAHHFLGRHVRRGAQRFEHGVDGGVEVAGRVDHRPVQIDDDASDGPGRQRARHAVTPPRAWRSAPTVPR
ncbi:protein serine/threonine phosphatase [Corchorus olitorius]|uniref:Protein serine/threonine phosphatase n=1 Tax=Corchorus olitorius TaxID=93759 RepID=A0A1R3L2J6_9ROSI|nr:protein serine/threonine phosphatase [Corchorus olitorius]